MFYCAFTLSMFASAIVTLLVFIASDHLFGLAFRTMGIGAGLSIIEAFSGWLAVQSLDQFNTPLISHSLSVAIYEFVIVTIITTAAFFVARDIVADDLAS